MFLEFKYYDYFFIKIMFFLVFIGLNENFCLRNGIRFYELLVKVVFFL